MMLVILRRKSLLAFDLRALRNKPHLCIENARLEGSLLFFGNKYKNSVYFF